MYRADGCLTNDDAEDPVLVGKGECVLVAVMRDSAHFSSTSETARLSKSPTTVPMLGSAITWTREAMPFSVVRFLPSPLR